MTTLTTGDADFYSLIGFWKWVFESAIPTSKGIGLSSRRILCKTLGLNENIMRLDRPSTANFIFQHSVGSSGKKREKK